MSSKREGEPEPPDVTGDQPPPSRRGDPPPPDSTGDQPPPSQPIKPPTERGAPIKPPTERSTGDPEIPPSGGDPPTGG
jgi:hypothetical protein